MYRRGDGGQRRGNLFLIRNSVGNRADRVMDMSQAVGESVDLVQQRGQRVDGGAEEGEDEGFARGDVLVEFVIGRERVRVVDARLDESFFEEVPHVDEVFSGGDHRGAPSRGDSGGGEAEALRGIVNRHCSSLGVRQECSSLGVLRGAAH